MNKEKLTLANELNKKIDWAKNCLDSIEKLANSNKPLSAVDYKNSICVPEDLKHIFIALLKDYYETVLRELEQEFREI